MYPVTPEVKPSGWVVHCQGPWEMDGRGKSSPWLLSSCCSGIIVQRQRDKAWVRVRSSGGHEDSGWGTQREKGPVPLHHLPTAPFAEVTNEIFQVFSIFPEKHSVRQRKVFVNSGWIQGEISAPHTAIMQGGTIQKSQTWWDFPFFDFLK